MSSGKVVGGKSGIVLKILNSPIKNKQSRVDSKIYKPKDDVYSKTCGNTWVSMWQSRAALRATCCEYMRMSSNQGKAEVSDGCEKRSPLVVSTQTLG